MDPRIVFCVAWAKGGYLPTHTRTIGCRRARIRTGMRPIAAIRIFDDRAVRKVAQNRKPFLLQTYRRNMGGGKFVLMKDLSSPILVDGRLWGAFRMGYQ
jgi:methyl-accepting chemotaxis protein